MTWHGIRIDHHENDHSGLLLGAVRPVVDRLRDDPRVAEVVVRTHWANGPHVLIAVAADVRTFEEEIYPYARGALTAWLRDNPSRTALDAPDYARMSHDWARSEGLVLADARPFANNAVTVAAYDREPPMGLPALGEVRNRFQSSALDTIWHLLALRRENKAAFLAECACMIAAVGVVAGDDRFDFWPSSMRAHMEGYLASDPTALSRFEALHQRLGPGLARRMALLGLMGEVGEGRDPSQFDRWTDRLRAVLADIETVVDASHLHLAQHDVYAGIDLPLTKPPLLLRLWMVVARFALIRIVLAWTLGRLMKTSWAMRRAAIMKTQTHLQYRILINFVYGLLPLLGIGPTERASLCYLIWRSCETSFPLMIERTRRSVDRLADSAMLERAA